MVQRYVYVPGFVKVYVKLTIVLGGFGMLIPSAGTVNEWPKGM